MSWLSVPGRRHCLVHRLSQFPRSLTPLKPRNETDGIVMTGRLATQAIGANRACSAAARELTTFLRLKPP